MTKELLTLDDIIFKKGLNIDSVPIFKYDNYTISLHAFDVLCGDETDKFKYEHFINFNWKIFSDNPDKIIIAAMVNSPPNRKTWHEYCNQPSKIIDLYNNPKDKIEKNKDNVLHDID